MLCPGCEVVELFFETGEVEPQTRLGPGIGPNGKRGEGALVHIPCIWERNRGAVNCPNASFVKRFLLNAEILAQIDAAHVFVLHHLVGAARHQHPSIVKDISPINDFQRFPDVVIGDQNADTAFLQM